jgi:hypothetical protein
VKGEGERGTHLYVTLSHSEFQSTICHIVHVLALRCTRSRGGAWGNHLLHVLALTCDDFFAIGAVAKLAPHSINEIQHGLPWRPIHMHVCPDPFTGPPIDCAYARVCPVC